ncbi:kinetochore-associated Ndc80 complex subunit nuf2 [Gonapodya sp. JEL0774]|nr:kinetochore-associated Ndc80 complex subunit nuf2 [Gonapodya sp. JEL0774]
MTAQVHLSFPVLKTPDVLHCLSDLGLSCSDDDLKNPTPLGVQRIYEQLLGYLLGAAARDFFPGSAGQPAFQVLQHLDNPELHMDALQALVFYKQLSKILRRVGYPLFTLRDLQRPDPLPLRRALSALINFAKFREERLGMWEAMQAKAEDLDDQRLMTEQRFQALEARVNALRLLRAEQEPLLESAKAENISISEKLTQSGRQRRDLESEIDRIRLERKKETERQAETEQRTAQVKQDVARLKGRIVENPEGLRRTIVDMTGSLAGERLAVAEKERKLRELKARADVLGRFEQDLDRLQPTLAELESELKRLNVALRGPTEAREALERAQGELKDLEAKGMHLARQVQVSQEKLTRLTQLAAQKRKGAAERARRSKEDLELLRKDRNGREKAAQEEKREGDEWAKKVRGVGAAEMGQGEVGRGRTEGCGGDGGGTCYLTPVSVSPTPLVAILCAPLFCPSWWPFLLHPHTPFAPARRTQIEHLREQHGTLMTALDSEYARLKAQLETYAREVVQACGGLEGELRKKPKLENHEASSQSSPRLKEGKKRAGGKTSINSAHDDTEKQGAHIHGPSSRIEQGSKSVTDEHMTGRGIGTEEDSVGGGEDQPVAEIPRDESFWLDSLDSRNDEKIYKGLVSMATTLHDLLRRVETLSDLSTDVQSRTHPSATDTLVRDDVVGDLDEEDALRYYLYKAYVDNRPTADDLTVLIGELGEGASSAHYGPLFQTLAALVHLSHTLGPRRMSLHLVRLLSQRVVDLVDLLGPRPDMALAKAVLGVMRELVICGGVVGGRSVVGALSAELMQRLLGRFTGGHSLGARSKPKPTNDDKPDVSSGGLRKSAIGLLLSLVKSPDAQVRTSIFGMNGVITALLGGLWRDNLEDASRIVLSLENHISSDTRTSQSTFVGVFDSNLLSALYSFSVDSKTPDQLRLPIRSLLMALSTRPGRGVCFQSDGLCLNAQGKVYNPILAGFLKTLKLVDFTQDMEVVFGVLGAAPELVEGFLSSPIVVSINLDPQPSPQWLWSMAFLLRIVRLPTHLGSQVPALSSILSNTCPPLFTRNVMVKGLMHNDATVRYVMAEAVRTVLDKASQIISELRTRKATTEVEEFQAVLARLLPDLQSQFACAKLCFAASIAPGASEDSKHAHAAGLRCFAGYTKVFGGAVAGRLRADMRKVIGPLNAEGGGDGDDAVREAAMEIIEIGGWVKVDGTVDSSGRSQLHPFLLLLLLSAPDSSLRARAITGVTSLLRRTFPFDAFPDEAPCLVSALLAAGDRHVTMREEGATFVDGLMSDMTQHPYRSVDIMSEMLGRQWSNLTDARQDCKGYTPEPHLSPLLCLALRKYALFTNDHPASQSIIDAFMVHLLANIADRTSAPLKILRHILEATQEQRPAYGSENGSTQDGAVQRALNYVIAFHSFSSELTSVSNDIEMRLRAIAKRELFEKSDDFEFLLSTVFFCMKLLLLGNVYHLAPYLRSAFVEGFLRIIRLVQTVDTNEIGDSGKLRRFRKLESYVLEILNGELLSRKIQQLSLGLAQVLSMVQSSEVSLSGKSKWATVKATLLKTAESSLQSYNQTSTQFQLDEVLELCRILAPSLSDSEKVLLLTRIAAVGPLARKSQGLQSALISLWNTGVLTEKPILHASLQLAAEGNCPNFFYMISHIGPSCPFHDAIDYGLLSILADHSASAPFLGRLLHYSREIRLSFFRWFKENDRTTQKWDLQRLIVILNGLLDGNVDTDGDSASWRESLTPEEQEGMQLVSSLSSRLVSDFITEWTRGATQLTLQSCARAISIMHALCEKHVPESFVNAATRVVVDPHSQVSIECKVGGLPSAILLVRLVVKRGDVNATMMGNFLKSSLEVLARACEIGDEQGGQDAIQISGQLRELLKEAGDDPTSPRKHKFLHEFLRDSSDGLKSSLRTLLAPARQLAEVAGLLGDLAELHIHSGDAWVLLPWLAEEVRASEVSNIEGSSEVGAQAIARVLKQDISKSSALSTLCVLTSSLTGKTSESSIFIIEALKKLESVEGYSVARSVLLRTSLARETADLISFKRKLRERTPTSAVLRQIDSSNVGDRENGYVEEYLVGICRVVLHETLSDDDLHYFIEVQLLGFLVSLLSSEDESLRNTASALLSKCLTMIVSSKLKERKQLLLALTTLRNSIVSEQRVPGPITYFMSETVRILLEPDNTLYPLVNRFLLQRPIIDLTDIPMFYDLTFSASKVHRRFMLKLLVRGLQSKKDLALYSRRHAFSTLMSLTFSSALEREDRVIIVQALSKAASLASQRALTELQQMGETLNAPFLRHFFRNFDPQSSKPLRITMSHFSVRHFDSADYRSAYHQLCDWFYGWNVTDATEIVPDTAGTKLGSSPKLRRIPRDIDMSLDVEKQECARISQTFETLFAVSRRALNRMYIDIDEKMPVLGMGTLAKAKNRNGQDGTGGGENGSDEGLARFDDKEKVWADAAGMVAVASATSGPMPGLPATLSNASALSPSPSGIDELADSAAPPGSASGVADKSHLFVGTSLNRQGGKAKSHGRKTPGTKLRVPNGSSLLKPKSSLQMKAGSESESDKPAKSSDTTSSALASSPSSPQNNINLQIASPTNLSPENGPELFLEPPLPSRHGSSVVETASTSSVPSADSSLSKQDAHAATFMSSILSRDDLASSSRSASFASPHDDSDNESQASSSSSLDESEQFVRRRLTKVLIEIDDMAANGRSSSMQVNGETEREEDEEESDMNEEEAAEDDARKLYMGGTSPANTMAAVLRAVMKDDSNQALRNLQSDLEVVYADLDRSVDYTLICVGNILVVLAIAELLRDEVTFRNYVSHAVEISGAFVSNTLKTVWDLLRKEVPRESLTLADLREPLLLRSVVRRVAELRTPPPSAEAPYPKLAKIPIRKIHRKVQLLHSLLVSVDVQLLPRFVLAHKSDCKAAAASRYGASLWLTGGYDGVVRIHDLATRTTLAQYVGHKSVVTDVHFAKDDTHVVSCSFDRTVKIWNAQTAVCERTLQGHTDSVTSCDVSPDGRFVATGSLDCSVRLWDYTTGDCLCVVKKHTRWVKVVRFTPDGRYLASAGLDRRVFFWDVKLMANTKGTVTQSRVIEAHGDYVLDLAMAKPSYVATCSRDMTVKVFDYVTGHELHSNSIAPSWACSVSFSPDGEFYATGSFDNNIVVFRTKTGERVRSFRVFNLGVSVVRFAKGMASVVCGTGEGYLQEIPL